MIKKLLLSGVVMMSASSVFAQLDTKLNLLGVANKKIELSLEAGHDKLGLELTLGYSFKPWADGVSVNDEDISVPRNGFLVGFRPNYYFKPVTTLNGFYVSPYTYYSRLKVKLEEPAIHNKATVGLIFGRKGHIYEQFSYLVEAGLGYNVIYKYTDAATKEKREMEESIPIFGGLTKINIPLRVSIIYRLGEQ